ncbi:CinA family protein [Asticcacaulis sp. AC402]|uniref:CinA family protein n=1 Tax=Asticcacaulis sp. AC402 TaxID=1282361 RepID=UPI0004008C0F|nr:CinA family protein [Asticcacaulis sp. AC402]
MENKKLAHELVHLLQARGQRVTTAESCTGGLIAGAITSVPGSSDVFETGFITYSNAAKTALVGVSDDLLEAHGAVSIEVAAAMANGARAAAKADMALSVTGIAGPGGGTLAKPVGMVCFGLSYTNAEKQPLTLVQLIQFGDIGRDKVREKSVEHALQWALDTLTT